MNKNQVGISTELFESIRNAKILEKDLRKLCDLVSDIVDSESARMEFTIYLSKLKVLMDSLGKSLGSMYVIYSQTKKTVDKPTE